MKLTDLLNQKEDVMDESPMSQGKMKALQQLKDLAMELLGEKLDGKLPKAAKIEVAVAKPVSFGLEEDSEDSESEEAPESEEDCEELPELKMESDSKKADDKNLQKLRALLKNK